MAPTYEYLCTQRHKVTTVESIHDKAQETCSVPVPKGKNWEGTETWAKCGAPCKRLIFPVGFELKGDGWAKDGYSSGRKKENSEGKKEKKW